MKIYIKQWVAKKFHFWSCPALSFLFNIIIIHVDLDFTRSKHTKFGDNSCNWAWQIQKHTSRDCLRVYFEMRHLTYSGLTLTWTNLPVQIKKFTCTVKLDHVNNYCLNKVYLHVFTFCQRCKMLVILDGKVYIFVTNIAGSIHSLGNIFCEYL